MKLTSFCLLASVALLFSCSPASKMNKSLSSLYQHKWALKKIHSESYDETVTTKAFIKFNKEKGSAGGNGSCNSFGSNTVINGNAISFSNIFSTKMYCDDVQKTENSFLKLLPTATRFEVKRKRLLLYNSDKLILEFEAEESTN